MEMKFNSQICTTREQSERLLALGLKPETADMTIVGKYMGTDDDGAMVFEDVPTAYPPMLRKDIPAWSLHRLLSLYNLHYIEFMNDEEIESVYDIVIDAIEQAIKEGYFNKEYLV